MKLVVKNKKYPYRTKGRVVSIQKFGGLIELEETKEVGILHISKISPYFISDLSNFLTVGETIRVDVLNKNDQKIELSILNIPHYRNLKTKEEEIFRSLARSLPFWIKGKIREQSEGDLS